MNENEILEKFAGWVESLPEDAKALRAAVEDEAAKREAKRHLIAGLSYLLRKIDIVPDYLGGLGSVDDAMVIRMSAHAAQKAGLEGLGDEPKAAVEKLAAEIDVIQDFLEDLTEPFTAYVEGLPEMKVRGRTADRILDEPEAWEQFGYELNDELKSYEVRPVEGGAKALRELRSFIKAKVMKKKE
jgi:uncharacterized membrane protein YkvA (DUF1232 family)